MKTKTTRWLIATTAVLLACAAAGSSAFADRTFISNYEGILGTSLELKVHASNQAVADRAERLVLAEIARQSSILSSWDASSEFSRWTRSQGEPVRVSRDLFEVLDLFDRWRVRSNGALDASAQAVIRAWSAAAAKQRVPTSDELAAAVRIVQQRHWTLNPAQRTATHLSNAPLVLASFTKSYIIDRAVNAAMGLAGVRAVVLNIGGDIVARGAVAEAIDIADPKDDAENGTPISEIVVHDRAVATSGDYRRGIDIAGVHYSHIVDPRTGMTAEHVISSTVVAANPTDAGALATAFSILTPAESRTLAASLPGVEYLLVDKDGKRIASPGWTALEASARAISGAATPVGPMASAPRGAVAALPDSIQAGGAAWDPTMELSVNFEIPVLGGAAKRPFIAIWLEDVDKFPVRTLALWYHEDRFLTEVKAWYRADRLRSMSENTSIVRSIGAATRPPGKYTLKWDGKDNDGNFVKPGTYIVSLESSREHGTYQLNRQEMKLGSAPVRVDFRPGTELGVSSFDYHKIAK